MILVSSADDCEEALDLSFETSQHKGDNRRSLRLEYTLPKLKWFRATRMSPRHHTL